MHGSCGSGIRAVTFPPQCVLQLCIGAPVSTWQTRPLIGTSMYRTDLAWAYIASTDHTINWKYALLTLLRTRQEMLHRKQESSKASAIRTVPMRKHTHA